MWIDGLLFELRHYQVNGKMYFIIRTFLQNREAIIELSVYLSPAFKIDIGVPQGSVLPPLLVVVINLHATRGQDACLAKPTSVKNVQPVWPTTLMKYSAQSA